MNALVTDCAQVWLSFNRCTTPCSISRPSVLTTACQAESSAVLCGSNILFCLHRASFTAYSKAVAHFSNWMGALSASKTSHTAALTSGPIPSPGMSVTFWIFASPGDGT